MASFLGRRTSRISASIAAALLLGAAAVLAQPTGQQDPGDQPDARRLPTVRVDPRVELLSIIFRLAGNPEYNQGRVPGYLEDFEKQFGRMREHAVVQLARELRASSGVSFDACMSMAAHLTDPPELAPRAPFDAARSGLDARWPRAEAQKFVELARAFVQESAFVAFFAAHEQLYERTAERLRTTLAQEARMNWFDRFFGARPGARFTLAIGMLNGGSCYGASFRAPDGQEDLYCVLGVWMVDQNDEPRFDASVISTVVHEFCHSYTNPLIDAHAERLAPAGKALFEQVETMMRRQAYGEWKIMLYESLVRACVARYMSAQATTEQMERLYETEEQNDFLWIRGLSELLAKYEDERDKYPTLESFMPRVVEFFDQQVEETRRKVASAPRITRMAPANGASDADPELTAIVIEFDRPMKDGSWSVVGGGPHFPEVAGQPSYDAARRVLTWPVKLKPDWSYEFFLNSGKFQGFRAEDGAPLRPTHVTFQTGARSGG